MEWCVANWPLILEYLKVLLTWPPVLALLILWIVRQFRQELQKLIDRIRFVDAFGAKLATDLTEAQAKAEAAVPTPPQAAAGQQGGGPIGEISRDPARAQAEILKWWSAAKFESLLNVAFGTQVRMLDALSRDPLGARLADLMPFYVEHQQRAGSMATPFGNFVAFLTVNDLIRLEGEGEERRAFLTAWGEQFLRYLIKTYGPTSANMRQW